MSRMIGIHQQTDMKYLHSEPPVLQPGQCASVGPFSTHALALAWQEFMQKRCTGCTIMPLTATDASTTPWYGFILEE